MRPLRGLIRELMTSMAQSGWLLCGRNPQKKQAQTSRQEEEDARGDARSEPRLILGHAGRGVLRPRFHTEGRFPRAFGWGSWRGFWWAVWDGRRPMGATRSKTWTKTASAT
jgi:hypothetical protein